MERMLKKHMMEYMNNSSLISCHQHGFVSNKSCSTNLLETLDIVTESLNRRFAVDLIFLDFAKAFDKVSHSELLTKLIAYGFDEKIVAWINSFLKNRQQRVVLGDNKSNWNYVL